MTATEIQLVCPVCGRHHHRLCRLGRTMTGRFEKGRWVEDKPESLFARIRKQAFDFESPYGAACRKLWADLWHAALKSDGRSGRFVAGAWIPARTPDELHLIVTTLRDKPREAWTDDEARAWREAQVQVRLVSEQITATFSAIKTAMTRAATHLAEALAPVVTAFTNTVSAAFTGMAPAIKAMAAAIEQQRPARRLSWAERQARRGY